jgi:hypothetical protein
MKNKSLLVFSTITSFVILLSGCSKSPNITSDQKYWLKSGQITISRALPSVSAPRSLNMLGFLPVLGSHAGIWLSIDTSAKKVELMDGNRLISASDIEDAQDIGHGSFQVLHMQKDALWYAPDQYFIKRNMSVPGQGDKARFRRGALGEYAIFLNKDTPIHSGPVYSEEIGGIRLKENDLSKIFYQLQIGSIIDVK